MREAKKGDKAYHKKFGECQARMTKNIKNKGEKKTGASIVAMLVRKELASLSLFLSHSRSMATSVSSLHALV